MNDFNASDKIVLAVLLYLVFITILQWLLIYFNPDFHSQEESVLFAGFAEFVLGGILGYIGGKSEGKL